MAGMMAMSTLFVRRASAHCEGMVKDRSYLPRNGPCEKPHTNGAVFKYSTIEMRSGVNRLCFQPKLDYSKASGKTSFGYANRKFQSVRTKRNGWRQNGPFKWLALGFSRRFCYH